MLSLLRDPVTVDGVRRRCALIPSARRSSSRVLTGAGERAQCSLEAVFRVRSAPTVGAVLVTRDGTTARVASVTVFDASGPWMRHARVYAATREDVLGGPTTDDLTFIPAGVVVDAYGTRTRVPDDTAAFDLVGRLDPVDSGEDTSDGQRSYRTWTLTVDADLAAYGVDAWAKVIGPDGAEYAFDGDPITRVDVTGLSWSTARLRSWGAQPVAS
jgi:hypothetical protein